MCVVPCFEKYHTKSVLYAAPPPPPPDSMLGEVGRTDQSPEQH